MSEEIIDMTNEVVEEITLAEVKADIPRVFAKPTETEPDVTFDFVLHKIQSAGMIRNKKTRMGVGNLYILNSKPEVQCFRSAYVQLEKHLIDNKHISKKGDELKKSVSLRYKTREGDTLTTKYIFEDL